MTLELEEIYAFQCFVEKLEPVRQYKFCPNRKWIADFAFVGPGLLVEIEGGTWINGRHQRGAGFEADALKYAAAMEHGFQVLRVTGKMVRSGLAIAITKHLLWWTDTSIDAIKNPCVNHLGPSPDRGTRGVSRGRRQGKRRKT